MTAPQDKSEVEALLDRLDLIKPTKTSSLSDDEVAGCCVLAAGVFVILAVIATWGLSAGLWLAAALCVVVVLLGICH